jgi:integrase/recombinase XerD
MTPELERFIEQVYERAEAEAAEREAIERALRQAWQSEGGRAMRRFVETRPAATTRRIYLQHLEDYLVWVTRNAGGIDLLDATPEDLARYERDVLDRVSKATGKLLALRTRQERVRTVRTAYQFCVDEGLIDRSPARHVRIRGRAEPKRTFLSDAGAHKLLEACAGERLSDARDRSLITVLLHSGIRAAEAASLTWGDLDSGQTPKLTVEGKGRVVRTIPLSDEAVAALDGWAGAARSNRKPSERVWTRLEHRVSGEADRAMRTGSWRKTEKALTSLSIHGIVVRRAAKAGLENVTPHTLRRTYATKLKRLGLSLDTIQRYLGHASILTTASYFDPVDEEAVAAVRSLRYAPATNEPSGPKKRR